MSDIPSLSNGRRAIKDPIVENLNVLISGSPLRYHYIKDGFKVPGRTTKHDLENEGVHLGVDIRSSGAQEGAIDLQLDKATDAVPLPAHILRVTKGQRIKFYGITDGSEPNERNAPVRISPSAIELINPVLAGLLSADLGDTAQQTYSLASMATTETFDTKPVNHRTGATKAYTATLEDGSALPTGITINPATGVLTFTKATVLAGVYTIKVVATDTIATLPANHPHRVLENEQTLIATVTA